MANSGPSHAKYGNASAKHACTSTQYPPAGPCDATARPMVQYTWHMGVVIRRVRGQLTNIEGASAGIVRATILLLFASPVVTATDLILTIDAQRG